MRRALTVAALAIVWLLVLGSAAGIPWSAPLYPRKHVALNGSDFRPIMGAGVEDGKGLGVGAIASDGNALQSVTIDVVHAADLPILTYRFEDFPRTLELSLVFRRADAPNDVQAILLPWPGDGPRSVDLSVLPAWRGEIVELGFAEYATAQLVPPSIAFQPFRLARAQLASPAWAELPALIRTAWFGYQPWSLLSISALGPSLNALKTPAMSPAIAIGALLTFAILAWLGRWNRARMIRRGLLLAALAWIALDLRWLDDLSAKHDLIVSLYGGKSWEQRARLQPDEDVAGFAQLTRQQLAAIGSPQRVLIASDSTYTLLRLIYLLLPVNAVPLESALATAPAPTWPANSVIVLCNSRRWHFDDSGSVLRSEQRTITVTPVFAGSNFGVYRLRGAGG